MVLEANTTCVDFETIAKELRVFAGFERYADSAKRCDGTNFREHTELFEKVCDVTTHFVPFIASSVKLETMNGAPVFYSGVNKRKPARAPPERKRGVGAALS